MKAMNDNIIVSRIPEPDQTVGGIIIPETAKLKSRKGRVLSIGPGRVRSDGTRTSLPGVNVGDAVYFRGISGQEMTFRGEDYVVLKFDEVEGVVTEL